MSHHRPPAAAAVVGKAERVLDIATLGAPPALACMKRIAWERSASDYRCHPGGWGWEQTVVQVTLRGAGACWTHGVAGQAVAVPPGSALVYTSRHHRDLVYGRDEAHPWEFLYCTLIGTAAVATVRDIVALRGHVLPLPVDHPLVREALALLPREVHEYAAWPVERSAAFAQRLLLALAEALAPRTGEPDDRLAMAAMALLAEDVARGWDVAAVAAELGVTREHLTRVFAARVGEPPARWLRRQRIASAARRLRAGERVAQVALACGFTDVAHFSGVFRRHVGVGPADFRRRGGIPGW